MPGYGVNAAPQQSASRLTQGQWLTSRRFDSVIKFDTA